MVVHQLLPRLSFSDPAGRTAVALQLLLRRMGHFGELYAHRVEDGLQGLARSWKALQPRPTDLVILHHGLGSPMASWLLTLQCQRAVYFHNPGPGADVTSNAEGRARRMGRVQLASLSPHTSLAFAASSFDARVLHQAGFSHPHLLPPFIEPERFGLHRAAPRLLHKLRRPSPTLLAVGYNRPHQRLTDLLALHRELLRLRPDARLLLLDGEPGAYAAGMREWALKGLPGVMVLDSPPHAERVAAYRSASLFISMSEHESFPFPWLEAMAAEVPVMAFAAGAAEEALHGHGVLFTEKDFAFLAELSQELCSDGAVRASVLEGQAKRVEELTPERAGRRLAAALAPLVPTEVPQIKPSRARVRARVRVVSPRPRVGLVVQRFGELMGGAELHARQLARALAPHFDLTVLTTCAQDHLSWKNLLPAGAQEVGDLTVLRFATTRPRALRAFNALSRRLFRGAQERLAEEQWVAEQGPLVPELLHHLAAHGDRYDAFIFFTYLYLPTAWGLPLVAPRALVVPTAHDEPPLAFDVFEDVFTLPAALMCNTPEEAELISRRFPKAARSRVVGVGVDEPLGVPGRFARQVVGVGVDEPLGVPGRFARARVHAGGGAGFGARAEVGSGFGARAEEAPPPYMLYVGRMESGKGLPELLQHHAALVRAHPDAPELLLAGSGPFKARGKKVRMLGRISDEAKRDALAGAVATVVPSRYESLSLLALESFAQGTPVLGNGASEVLAGQVRRSGAGALFRDSESFEDGVFHVLAQRPEMSAHAKAFAKKHTWAKVVEAYREEVARIMKGRR